MTQQDRTFILDQMQVASGTKLTKIARAGAMGSLILTSQGGQEYVLHLQCAFRYRLGTEILMANFDMFEPTDEAKNASSFDWNVWSDAAWDTQGANLYDEWALSWIRDGHTSEVETIEISETGDLTIRFCDGLILETFNNNSKSECWRFFERHADSDLIVTGCGIER
jgi:hypothetical protein